MTDKKATDQVAFLLVFITYFNPYFVILKNDLMRKFLTIILLLSGLNLSAQSLPDWLQPVYFPGKMSLCPDTAWKLVFSDDFEGNALDTTKWISFKSWKGMTDKDGTITDHEDWDGARYEGGKYIFRKENIEIDQGTAKLKIRYEPFQWKCNSCPESQLHQGQYTSAALCTYYHYKGSNTSFDHGKFEFRARFPDFPQSFGTAWTWYGNRMGVNELDLAESNGRDVYQKAALRKWLPGNWRQYTGNITYPTHAWGNDHERADTPYVLPFHKKANVTQEVNPPRYPHQSWYDFIANTYFDFTQWHTYTTEWDSISVSTYLDHQLVGRLPKYYRWSTYRDGDNGYRFKVAVDCVAEQGVYEVSRGFPYRTGSGSQLRFTTGVGPGARTDSNRAVQELGALELDYVKIWQRAPMGQATDLGMHKAAEELAPEQKTTRPVVLCSRNYFTRVEDFCFKVISPQPGAAYRWTISYTVGDEAFAYETDGAAFRTPALIHAQQLPYTVEWTLDVKTDKGTACYSGKQDQSAYTPPVYTLPETYLKADGYELYVEARFTPQDSVQYEGEVRQHIAQSYIFEASDTTAIKTMIANAYIERLEQYLYFAPETVATEPHSKKDRALVTVAGFWKQFFRSHFDAKGN